VLSPHRVRVQFGKWNCGRPVRRVRACFNHQFRIPLNVPQTEPVWEREEGRALTDVIYDHALAGDGTSAPKCASASGSGGGKVEHQSGRDQGVVGEGSVLGATPARRACASELLPVSELARQVTRIWAHGRRQHVGMGALLFLFAS